MDDSLCPAQPPGNPPRAKKANLGSTGSMLRAGGWPRRERPRGAHHTAHSPVPTCWQGSALLTPSRTFGAGEKQLIGGIQAEHGLGVSFCHGDALQRGRPGVLGAPHRVDDAPCTGEKGEAWWGACARRGAPRVPGTPQASSTTLQGDGPPTRTRHIRGNVFMETLGSSPLPGAPVLVPRAGRGGAQRPLPCC